MRAVVAGGDPSGLGEALIDEGVTVATAAGTATRTDLLEVDIEDADLFVLTDAGLATAIPVALDVNPSLRVICYTRDSLPEFVSGQAGLVIDPDLIDPDVVAAELVDGE